MEANLEGIEALNLNFKDFLTILEQLSLDNIAIVGQFFS